MAIKKKIFNEIQQRCRLLSKLPRRYGSKMFLPPFNTLFILFDLIDTNPLNTIAEENFMHSNGGRDNHSAIEKSHLLCIS